VDGITSDLFIKRSASPGTTGWVSATQLQNDFIGLTDTPSSYTGNAGLVVQVNDTPNALEFGQALRTIDTPRFANLILRPNAPGATDIVFRNSSDSNRLIIQYNEVGNNAFISGGPGVSLNILNDFGSLIFSTADETKLESVSDLFLKAAGKVIVDQATLELIPAEPAFAAILVDSVNMDTPRDLFIVNNYAYVISAGVSSSISIIDITEPTNPVLVGSLLDGVNLPNPSDIVVAGKYAYITSFDNDSLAIVDVSDVSAPVFVASFVSFIILSGAIAVQLAGKFCYVLAEGPNVLAIIDISDPNDPALIGALADAVNLSSPQHIYILGSYAYVTLSSRLKIIDITDPTAPVIVGDLDLAGIANSTSDIYVVGRYAYITGEDSDSLAVIDVSDPSTPVLAGSVSSASLLDSPWKKPWLNLDCWN